MCIRWRAVQEGYTTMARDRLTFDAELVNGRIVTQVHGWDHRGNVVGFEVKPAIFVRNMTRQLRHAQRVEMIAEQFDAMVATGMSPQAAWEWCQALLPGPLTMGVALWDASEGSG